MMFKYSVTTATKAGSVKNNAQTTSFTSKYCSIVRYRIYPVMIYRISQSNQPCILRFKSCLLRLALTDSIASGDISIPINRRFRFAAAIAVVPPPRNGSRICIPSMVNLEIIYSASTVLCVNLFRDLSGLLDSIRSLMELSSKGSWGFSPLTNQSRCFHLTTTMELFNLANCGPSSLIQNTCQYRSPVFG